MTAGWLILAAGVLVAVAGRVAYLRFKPMKPCPGCRGKGYCMHCNLTGKVPRFGARWVRRELRRK